MDRKQLEDNLAMAEQRLVNCDRHVSNQLARFAQAEVKRYPTAIRAELHQLFLQNRKLFQAHRDRLRKELELLTEVAEG